MRWISRFAVAGAAALVLAGLWRPVIRAGGGIPEGDGKKVDPVRPGPKPKPGEIISLTRRSTRRTAGEVAGSAGKRKRLKAAQVVPRNALFYVSVPDVSRLTSAARELALAKMLGEDAIHSRISDFLKRVRRSSGGSGARGLSGLLHSAFTVDLDLDIVGSALRKEFALVGLPPVQEGEGGPRFAAVAACAVASQRPLAEMMETVIGQIHARNLGAYEPIPEEHGGAEIRGLRLEGFEISYAFYENLFLFGIGKDTLAELINTDLDGPKAQIGGDAAFRAAEERLGRGATVFYRVDMQGVMKALGPVVAVASGGNRVGVLSGAIYLDGEAIREKIEAKALPGQSLSSVKLGDPLATPPKSIDYFSLDTVLYVATSIESAEAVADVAKDPQTALAMQSLGQMAQAAGIDAARDIVPALSAFGGEIAAGLILPRGRPAELLVVLEVKKKSVLGRAEDAIRKLAGGKMKETSYRKIDILYAEPPARPEEARGIQYVLPSLSCARVGRNIFMVASSRRALEKAIRQRSFRPSSLREKEDYVRCLGGLRPQRTSILYVDAKRCIEAIRGPIVTPVGATFPGLGGSEVVGVLERNIFGLGVVSGGSGESAFVESCGPVGPMTGAGIGALALLQNAFGESSALAPAKDAENLSRIGVALQLYATDFDRFPARLSELYDEYMDDLKYFMAPGEEKDVKSKDDIDARCDYVYVRGLSPLDLSDLIIAYSRKPLQGPRAKGRNVLYLNGKVEFRRESGLDDLLKSAPEK